MQALPRNPKVSISFVVSWDKSILRWDSGFSLTQDFELGFYCPQLVKFGLDFH
jgi:hypothetical protein